MGTLAVSVLNEMEKGWFNTTEDNVYPQNLVTNVQIMITNKFS